MIAIIAISVVVLGVFLAMNGSDGKYGEDAGMAEFNGLDLLLWWAYALLVFGILAAVVMSIINVGKNPGSAKRGLFGLVILAVVLIVAYLLSSDAPVAIGGGKIQFTDKVGLTVADMGLYTAYFALAAAFGVAIYGGIKNSFK